MSRKYTYKVNLDISDEDAMRKAVGYADVYYDGHFTLLKFTSNYRFCFGTLNAQDGLVSHRCTYKMAKGRTIGEAIAKAINDDINDEAVLEATEAELAEDKVHAIKT